MVCLCHRNTHFVKHMAGALITVSKPLVKSAYQKNNFLISQPKHVVGTQKNHLNETALLSTQNIC